MKQGKYVALGVGIFAVFLLVCGGAFFLGKNNSNSDSPTVVMPEVGSGVYSSLEGVDTTSKELRLQDYSGEVSLRLYNESKTPSPGMRLENQDRLATALASSAYLTMDQTRVMRLNEASEVTVSQGGEELSFHLAEGTVFFNVTEPLSPTETLEFSTNNVVTGVRGTSGVISYALDGQGQAVSQIALLTGTLDCYAIDSTTTERPQFSLVAGEVAIVTSLPDGTVDIEILKLEKENLVLFLPDDFIDTIQGDLNGEGNSVPWSEYLREDELDYLSLYQEVLDEHLEWEKDPHIYLWYTDIAYEILDIDQNGIKDLLLTCVDGTYGLYTIQNGQVVDLGMGCMGTNWTFIHNNGMFSQYSRGGMSYNITIIYDFVDGEIISLADHEMHYDMDTEEVTMEYSPDQETYEYYNQILTDANSLPEIASNPTILIGTAWW